MRQQRRTKDSVAPPTLSKQRIRDTLPNDIKRKLPRRAKKIKGIKTLISSYRVSGMRGQGVNMSNNITIKRAAKDSTIDLPSILYANVRALTDDKLDELQAIATDREPSLIGLTETWLNCDKQHYTSIEKYDSIFVNRQGRVGGGVGLLYQKKHHVTLINSYTSHDLSILWAHMVLKTTSIIIGVVYHPPGSNTQTTLDQLEKGLLQALSKHPRANIILLGDFNRLPLSNLCEQFNLRDLVNFSTRENAQLDHILTDLREYPPAQKVSPLVNCDHCSVFVPGTKRSHQRYVTITKRKITPQNKIAVQKDIASHDWNSLIEAETVDEKTEILHSTINAILDKHCPLKQVKRRHGEPGWMTPLIRKLIRARDKAFSKQCASWRTLQTLVRRTIRKAKRLYVENNINSACSNKQWWQEIKKLMGEDNSQSSDNKQHLIDGKRLSNQSLAEQLNEYFTTVGGNLLPYSPLNKTTALPLDPPSIGEVKLLLKSINTKKTTSSQDFPSWISKENSDDLCIPVHNIICAMLEQCQYPSLWKIAEICPIPKVANPQSCNQYRPISLLFHLGKIAEQVIINKLKPHITKLNPSQFAYQKGLSTTDALLQAIDDWIKILDEKPNTVIYTLCLDFSKAFDRVQKSTLSTKLNSLGVNANLVNLICDFLSDRKQCVKLNAVKSTTQPIDVGTAQGSKLGPLLWLFYVNDLQPPSVSCIKYADDCTLYSAAKNHVEESLFLATQWAKSNSMLLNVDKSVFCPLSLKARNHECLEASGQRLTAVPSTRFLGVYIDETLSFTVHIDHVTSKTRQRLHFLRKLRNAGANTNSLLSFYMANIRSVMTYAAPVWYTLLSKQDLNRLESIQRSATRIIIPAQDGYQKRLDILGIMPLQQHLEGVIAHKFQEIVTDDKHRLHQKIRYNKARRSNRLNSTFRPPLCRTKKCQNTFFNFYMSKAQ